MCSSLFVMCGSYVLGLVVVVCYVGCATLCVVNVLFITLLALSALRGCERSRRVTLCVCGAFSPCLPSLEENVIV